MQTFLSTSFKHTSDGQEADRILRACVHCGFCTATCPTYQVTGNELDSPRGRIYLIKSLLEGQEASTATLHHLDRCVSCQSCETTCPSDVEYHRLLSIGRRYSEKQGRRPLIARLKRYFLLQALPFPQRFQLLLGIGRVFRFMLPSTLKRQIPPRQPNEAWPDKPHDRRMQVLCGCVQNSLDPATNSATARILDRLGIRAERDPEEGCCGALAYHMNDQEAGLARAREQIDRLCKQLDDGMETIISTASGCGAFIQDYPWLFRDDPVYRDKATRVAAATADLHTVLLAEDTNNLRLDQAPDMSFHCPCTLQHGLGQGQSINRLLERLGFTLKPVRDAHLCCGSAGTYSIMQPAMASALRKRKIAALADSGGTLLATANIGCQQHLAEVEGKALAHWVVHLDRLLNRDAR